MKIFVFELIDDRFMPRRYSIGCICSFSQAGALRLAKRIAGSIILGMCYYEDEKLSPMEQIALLECDLNKGLIGFYNGLVRKLKRGYVELRVLKNGSFDRPIED